jgi:hypothetical protein
MPGSTVLKGQARTAYVSQNLYTVPGSWSLGAFLTGRAARFAGILSVTGSVTFNYRMAANSTSVGSSTFCVTSSFVVNSGMSTFDVLNYGHAAEFFFSAANSQIANTILVYGEGIR